jgi:hypothetical protein
VANEAVVHIALVLVNVDFVVIAKWELEEVALEVENDIAIYIDEEVAIALLRIDEAGHLQALVQVVGLAALERLLVLRPGDSGFNLGLLKLIRVLEAKDFCRRRLE